MYKINFRLNDRHCIDLDEAIVHGAGTASFGGIDLNHTGSIEVMSPQAVSNISQNLSSWSRRMRIALFGAYRVSCACRLLVLSA